MSITIKHERLRWWLWRQANRLPWVCPSSSHSRIVWGLRDRGLCIDNACRRDCAANGACWCGKVHADYESSTNADTQ